MRLRRCRGRSFDWGWGNHLLKGLVSDPMFDFVDTWIYVPVEREVSAVVHEVCVELSVISMRQDDLNHHRGDLLDMHTLSEFLSLPEDIG